ncbi:MAG: hypothetical protein KDA93_06875 [Planctomycetaceae bacterium]|nr:hypothetical protein [Planctomycetaceae bacterium]
MNNCDLLSLAEFYSAEADALQIKYRQIEHLIGLNTHSPSEGTYCEALLKEFLRRSLPRHVSVDNGFIRRVMDADLSTGSKAPLPTDADIVTPQLDIIIHDTDHFAPLFRSEDFVVVLPESVRAVIEVKKCLDRSKLEDAVGRLAKTTHMLRKWRFERNQLFTGIFAFSLGGDLSPKNKPFSDSFRSVFQNAVDEYGGDCELPYLTMALPHFALQEGNPPEKFDHLRTLSEDGEGPNVASQFLVFLLSHFTSWGGQGRSLPYPDALRSRRQEVFRVSRPQA